MYGLGHQFEPVGATEVVPGRLIYQVVYHSSKCPVCDSKQSLHQEIAPNAFNVAC